MKNERKQLMKTCKPVLSVLAVVLAFACIAIAAHTPKLTFNFKKANVPGAQQTWLSTINNEGVMDGVYQNKKGVYHGYILNGKKLTNLDDPNGTFTDAQGINFNGPIEVVGYYINSSGTNAGFLYNAKTKQFTDIPGPTGAINCLAEGINDKGWISGWYEDSGSAYHGFLLKGNNYTILDVPGATATYAYGINNKGEIVLEWVNSSGAWEGSLYNYHADTYTTIDVRGASGSEPSYINNKGDITFSWSDPSGLWHGALCTMCDSKGRRFHKFDYPKAVETYPNGVNDNKTFVGQYQDSVGGLESSFEATFK